MLPPRPAREQTRGRLLQLAHLFRPMELKQFARHRALGPSERLIRVTAEKEQTTDRIRAMCRLVETSGHFPPWVAPAGVVLRAASEPHLPGPPASGTHFPVVDTGPVEKRPGLPSLHSRSGDGDPIDAAVLDRDIPTDVFEARSPEQLAAARHVVDVREPVVVVHAAFQI